MSEDHVSRISDARSEKGDFNQLAVTMEKLVYGKEKYKNFMWFWLRNE